MAAAAIWSSPKTDPSRRTPGSRRSRSTVARRRRRIPGTRGAPRRRRAAESRVRRLRAKMRSPSAPPRGQALPRRERGEVASPATMRWRNVPPGSCRRPAGTGRSLCESCPCRGRHAGHVGVLGNGATAQPQPPRDLRPRNARGIYLAYIIDFIQGRGHLLHPSRAGPSKTATRENNTARAPPPGGGCGPYDHTAQF